MKLESSGADVRWMQRALRLARRGEGWVEPNPMVGCVLVRGDRIIGEGWHRRFGGPHAEVWALRQAGSAARGATAYVTLEPCHRFGKTPPCTQALIAAGVARVIAAVKDPNPLINGGGLRQLRSAGVPASVGLCADEGRDLLAPFWSLMVRRRPWVIAKWAQTLDGRLATAAGDSKWISGPQARRQVHQLRGRVDAVMVGIETVLADDPLLTCRDAPRRRIAARVVLDARLRTPFNSRLIRTIGDAPVIVYTSQSAAPRVERRLTARGAEVIRVPRAGRLLSLTSVLDDLGRRSMSRVLVEGGAAVIGSMMDQKLVDEACIYIHPAWIGDAKAAGILLSRPARRMSEALTATSVHWERVGEDACCRMRWR